MSERDIGTKKAIEWNKLLNLVCSRDVRRPFPRDDQRHHHGSPQLRSAEAPGHLPPASHVLRHRGRGRAPGPDAQRHLEGIPPLLIRHSLSIIAPFTNLATMKMYVVFGTSKETNKITKSISSLFSLLLKTYNGDTKVAFPFYER